MYTLVRNVHVHGQDFFGRAAQLHLFPNGRKRFEHWTIRAHDGQTTRLVTPELLHCSKRTISIVKGSINLPVVEHILPLAWFIAGVHIIQISPHPPYLMPGQLLDPTNPHTIRGACEKSKPRDWAPIVSGYEWAYPRKRGGERAYTRVTPIKRETLEVFVSINYPGVGRYEKTFDLEKMKEAELIQILSTQSQAIVPGGRLTQKLLKLCKWPHVDKVVWPDVSSEEARQHTLEAWANHRFLDILGAFGSLVDGFDCPAMRIESVCSGHEADVHVVRRIVTARPITPTQPLS